MKKAIFLDRDGVINQTVFKMGKPRAPYNLEEFKFIPGVEEAVRKFKDRGYLIIVVTNQADAARGWVKKKQVDLVNEHVRFNLHVDSIKVCFHTEFDTCLCRKPKPGMLLEAAAEFDIDLNSSYMVGDRMIDVEAGVTAGCTSILVGPGDETGSSTEPHHVCEDLLMASRWILTR
jgi:D-glycero-D-manno-heptose 1,7-bisphosphate phosphatase